MDFLGVASQFANSHFSRNNPFGQVDVNPVSAIGAENEVPGLASSPMDPSLSLTGSAQNVNISYPSDYPDLNNPDTIKSAWDNMKAITRYANSLDSMQQSQLQSQLQYKTALQGLQLELAKEQQDYEAEQVRSEAKK